MNLKKFKWFETTKEKGFGWIAILLDETAKRQKFGLKICDANKVIHSLVRPLLLQMITNQMFFLTYIYIPWSMPISSRNWILKTNCIKWRGGRLFNCRYVELKTLFRSIKSSLTFYNLSSLFKKNNYFLLIPPLCYKGFLFLLGI